MLNKKFVSKAGLKVLLFLLSLRLPLHYHSVTTAMMTVWRQIFFRLLVLVFRLLYCFSLLSFSINFPVILFCYFFLLFCIPLVYLWYSLIPFLVLSNHPLLSPSSPPISFRHLNPSLQLCPLPATLSPSGNSVPSGEPPSSPEPPPPSGNSVSSGEPNLLRLVLGDFPPSLFPLPPPHKKITPQIR